MTSITNTDIMNAIADLHGSLGRVEEIALATKAQAEKTNGRVTKIEEWKNALQAVEQYKKDQIPPVRTEKGDIVIQPPASYWESKGKLYAALGTLAAAAASALAFWVGSSQ